MSEDQLNEINLMERKQRGQKKIANIALALFIIVTVVILTPWIPESRIEKLEEILVWFYISDASIIGAFMGFSSWMSRK